MPRSRATEMPQRISPRAPTNLRTASSYSDPTHHRSRIDRSPKLAGGRSPRCSQPDPVGQKKLGTRIADLESQLGQAQQELKCLKDQLSSAEAAKRAVQEQLQKKSGQVKRAPRPVEIQRKHATIVQPNGVNKKEGSDESETSDDIHKETDVFEVQVDTRADQDELNLKSSTVDESALKNDEMNSLKMKIDEKDKEREILLEENEKMKTNLHQKTIEVSSAKSQIEELTLNINKVKQELEESKTREAQMSEKLEATEKAKEDMENEMKRLRVQTEQWRKAADAAASVLAGEVELNERRISERCGSMDKQYRIAGYETGGCGNTGYAGLPREDEDSDDVFGGGKRKSSGIRMFGDLWRKKGSK